MPQQPREFRILGWIGGIAFLITAIAFSSSLIASTTDRLEPNAVNKIKDLCGFHAECKVRVGDLFPGDWDTLDTFSDEASQAQLDATLGRGRARRTGPGSLLVLAHNGKIVRQELDPAGADLPRPNQVEFLDRARNPILHGRLTPDTWLWATAAKIHPDDLQSDTYYVLSPADLSPRAN